MPEVKPRLVLTDRGRVVLSILLMLTIGLGFWVASCFNTPCLTDRGSNCTYVDSDRAFTNVLGIVVPL